MVAIVLDDLGLDRKRTERAIGLPGPLTLSFMTYAEELPRQTYGIRAMRLEEGNNAEHYTRGALDGSRAGRDPAVRPVRAHRETDLVPVGAVRAGLAPDSVDAARSSDR